MTGLTKLLCSSLFVAGSVAMSVTCASAFAIALDYDSYNYIEAWTSKQECDDNFYGGTTGTCVYALGNCGPYDYDIYVEQSYTETLRDRFRQGGDLKVLSIGDDGYYSNLVCRYL